MPRIRRHWRVQGIENLLSEEGSCQGWPVASTHTPHRFRLAAGDGASHNKPMRRQQLHLESPDSLGWTVRCSSSSTIQGSATAAWEGLSSQATRQTSGDRLKLRMAPWCLLSEKREQVNGIDVTQTPRAATNDLVLGQLA